MKVALVGFSSKSNQAAHNLPDDTELWTLNHAHKFDFRVDRLFELHPEELLHDPNIYDPELRDKHLSFLESPHDFPIYTQEVNPEWPASVAYPLEEALELAGRRFHSTFAWMAALAILEGAEWVGIYGFDMDYETEYRYQKPNALYWIGQMEGRGIEVYIDPNSTLNPESKLYGFEVTLMIHRHTLEVHKERYEKQHKVALENLHKWQGVLHERQNSGKGDRQAAFLEVKTFENTAAMTLGAVEAMQNLIDHCDLLEDKQ